MSNPSTPNAPKYEEANMRCRNPRGCDSITAYVVPIPSHPSQRMYRCKKCSHTWGINVGGSVNL